MEFLELLAEIGNLLEEYFDNIGFPTQEKEKKKDLKKGYEMCGSLRHSVWNTKAPVKPGESFPSNTKIHVEKDGQSTSCEGETKWNGFAKSESLDKWSDGGWLSGTLQVDSYTEGGKEFSVPENQAVKVLILEKDKNYLNIVTRPAKTEEEKEAHHRHPVLIKKN